MKDISDNTIVITTVIFTVILILLLFVSAIETVQTINKQEIKISLLESLILNSNSGSKGFNGNDNEVYIFIDGKPTSYTLGRREQ